MQSRMFGGIPELCDQILAKMLQQAFSTVFEIGNCLRTKADEWNCGATMSLIKKQDQQFVENYQPINLLNFGSEGNESKMLTPHTKLLRN